MTSDTSTGDDTAAEHGKNPGRRPPERRCIITGDTGTPATLVRFAIGPEGQVVPDIDGKLPGRGIWVTARRDAVEKAVAKGLFARAAKQNAKAPADLADQVEEGLRRRVLALLGLARKAGQLMAGLAKVEDTAAKSHVVALFLASDAGTEGQRNAGALSTRTGAPVVAAFSAEQLGLALGRPNVVHAALTAGGAARKGPARQVSQPGAQERGNAVRGNASGAPVSDKLSRLILDEVGRLQGFLGGA